MKDGTRAARPVPAGPAPARPARKAPAPAPAAAAAASAPPPAAEAAGGPTKAMANRLAAARARAFASFKEAENTLPADTTVPGNLSLNSSTLKYLTAIDHAILNLSRAGKTLEADAKEKVFVSDTGIVDGMTRIT